MENKTETKAPNLLAAALKYHSAGYKVIFTNDSKIPVVGSWSKYRTSQTAEDIKAMFKANESKVKGLAVLCTDGMEVIDIDQKYSLDGRLMTDYLAAVSAEIGQDAFFAGVTISMTVSGGAHVIYKTDIQGGNQKLASRATVESEGAGSRVLLETRAKGGYIVVPPTKGYKFDVFDKTLAPKISNEWRNTLINVARTFDEVTNNFVARNVQPTPVEVKGAHLSTIDAFNEAHTPYELLIQAGWTFLFTKGGNDHLTRPGKRSGTSAGYNEAKNLVYIFTSSTEFENERAYNAFQVYTVLNHNGDYKEAARDLYRAGYGDRMTKTRDSDSTKQKAILSDNKESFASAVEPSEMNRIYKNNKFSINKKPKFIDYCLTYTDQLGDNYKVGAYGDLITITGAAKSRKSALGSSIVASAISGKDILRFCLKNGKRDILYIDTEQTEAEHYRVQTRVYKQAGVTKDPANYHAWTIGEETRLNMVSFIKHIIDLHKDIGVIFIDGIVDLCADYNDLKGSAELTNFIKKAANKHNILIINILHNARSTGDARGHLGTELINKSKAVIQVTKDEESGFSTVNFKYLREASPKDFDFEHDANGNLVTI